MNNEEQVMRNERYLRQTEARDYEEFCGLYEEEEPDFEEPEERRAPKGTASHKKQYKENSMFSQKMQQERTWTASAAEMIQHIIKLHNVEAEEAKNLFRDALDTLKVWTTIMEEVASSVEWRRADEEGKKALQERIRKEAEEAAREDAHYARLRGE